MLSWLRPGIALCSTEKKSIFAPDVPVFEQESREWILKHVPGMGIHDTRDTAMLTKIGSCGDAEIAIGSDAEDPQRLADFIDWLYSDEGVYDSQAQPNDGSAGPEGICWQMGTNGPELTEYGRKTFLEKQNNPIPGEEKLGTFRDGVSQLNYTAILLNQEDQRGYPFSYHMWETEKSRSKTLLQKEWSQYMNATDTMDYLQKNDKLLISPGCTYNAPEADSDVKEIRAACKKIIIRDSWKMIFAPNQNKFDALMENMRKQCLGL